MNGKNGTIFDWTMNEKLSDFMCFYKDGSCGAIKLRVNKDGSSKVYLYNYGKGQSFIDKELLQAFDKNEVYEVAIILNSVMDRNGVFDGAINDYNSDIMITDKEKLQFETDCNIMKGEKNDI